MNEFENAKAIVQALLDQKAANDALNGLRKHDVWINRDLLAQQANHLIDMRDAAQRRVEELLGTVSKSTRRDALEAFNSTHPNDEFGLQIAAFVRQVDGE